MTFLLCLLHFSPVRVSYCKGLFFSSFFVIIFVYWKLWRVARAKGIADTEDDWFVPPSTKKLCSVAVRKLGDRSTKLSTKPSGLTSPGIVESSSNGSSIQIADKEEKGLPFLYEDHALIFKRAKQLLSSDEMKQIEELGSHKALQKGISYSAKVIYYFDEGGKKNIFFALWSLWNLIFFIV